LTTFAVAGNPSLKVAQARLQRAQAGAVTFSGLSPQQMPAAAGLSNFVRITAGAVGTSLFTTAWDNRASLHHAQLAESINAGSSAAMQALSQLQAGGYTHEQALATVNRLIDQQAYTMAATDLFWLSSMLFVLLVGLVWLTRPKMDAAADAAAAGAH
jgi:DHA2 family multidrug resistance protein